MAYFYIKTGGSATGDSGRFATAQTGAFSSLSGYYGTLDAAFAATTPPTSGDFLCFSDAHSEDYGADLNLAGPVIGATAPLTWVNVSDSNCDQLAALPTNPHIYTTNSLYDWFPTGMNTLIGMYLQFSGHIRTNGDSQTIYHNCRLQLQSNADTIGVNSDGGYVEYRNCELDLYRSSNTLFGGAGNTFRAFGGSVTCTLDGFISDLFNAPSSGGSNFELIGVDLSALTGNIVGNTGAGATDDPIRVIISGCKLNAGVTFVEEDQWQKGSFILITNSAATSAAAEYQYYFQQRGGFVEDATNIYRNESTAFPSGTKVSLKVTTKSFATRSVPFTFPLSTTNVDLTNASSDTLRVYFACDTALDDTDIWIEAIYPDGTNKHEYLYKLSTTNAFSPFRSAGSTVVTDSGSTWKNGASDLAYTQEAYIDIDLSDGSECMPQLIVHVAKPSLSTLYIDTTIDAL